MKTLAERIYEAQASAVSKSVMDQRVARFHVLAHQFLEGTIGYRALLARAAVDDLEAGTIVLASFDELVEALTLLGREPGEILTIVERGRENLKYGQDLGCEGTIQIQFFTPANNQLVYHPSVVSTMPDDFLDKDARVIMRALLMPPRRSKFSVHILH